MESIIYVAGNPDVYPVEYYNKETGQYEGVLPELLHRFSEQAGYDIRYYEPGNVDKREQWADNLQVDLVSVCFETDDFRHVEGEELILIQTQQDGKDVTYGLYVTETAPDMLAEELRTFFSEISQEETTGMLIQVASGSTVPRREMIWDLAIVFGIALLLLAAVIGLTKRHYSRRIKQIGESDGVTGLGNLDYCRRYFRSYINDRNRILYNLFYFHVDIDRLGRTVGPDQTNEFLKYVSTTLQGYVSDTDILGRVSDSGFAILRLSVGEERYGDWLSKALIRIHDYSEGTIGERVVVAGVYSLKQSDRDPDEVITIARQTAMKAYETGKEYCVCDEEMIRNMAEERQLQEDIEPGLHHQEFRLYIQFYVDPVSNNIVGGEALSRWEHPAKGMLYPGRFIPLMEREGRIDDLDYYYLNKVCIFLEDISKIGVKEFFMSCNFSRRTFVSKGFVENCKRIIERHHFNKKWLIMELTESDASGDVEIVSYNIEALKKLGVQVALDDFGGGLTSFLDIQDCLPDALKLHRNLVAYVTTDTGEAILRSLIRICHDLGITAMAEGVETDEQAEILSRLSCDVVQGFRFYHPVPDWEVRKILLEQINHEGNVIL